MQTVSDKQIKLAAKIVDGTDKNARDASLNVCATFYRFKGEYFWKLVKKGLSSKGIDLLESRFKKLGLGGEEEQTPVPKQPKAIEKSPISGSAALKKMGQSQRNFGPRGLGQQRTPNKTTGFKPASKQNSSNQKLAFDRDEQFSPPEEEPQIELPFGQEPEAVDGMPYNIPQTEINQQDEENLD